MPYVYDTVQIPPNIEISKKQKGQEAAVYLANIINTKAAEGWEFQSVETIGVKDAPGCFGALSGGADEAITRYYVVVFKREA